MYSDIGQKSNTMIFSDRPADVNALMAQASAVVRAMSNNNVPSETVPVGLNQSSNNSSSSDRDSDLSHSHDSWLDGEVVNSEHDSRRGGN